MKDFLVQDHGSILVLYPCSEQAETWLDDHIPEDSMMWGNGVVVEPRYLPPILEGIKEDGLTFAM